MNRDRLLYGEWLVESDEERELRRLAEAYHIECEVYDRQVCTGISLRTGEAMPVTSFEMGLINRHARGVIMRMANEKGITEEQVHIAIKKYSK